MENNTKLQNTTALIERPNFFGGSLDIMYSYEVKDDGDVFKTHYTVTNISCDCFGCDYPVMKIDSVEHLGNCNDLRFLD